MKKTLVPKFGIDWRQPSTWRGAVLVVTVLFAGLFMALGQHDVAERALTGGLGAVGAIGLYFKD